MPIPVSCISCNATLKAPDAAAGKKARCPKCGNTMPIPALTPAAVQSPARRTEQVVGRRTGTARTPRKPVSAASGRRQPWLIPAVVAAAVVVVGGLIWGMSGSAPPAPAPPAEAESPAAEAAPVASLPRQPERRAVASSTETPAVVTTAPPAPATPAAPTPPTTAPAVAPANPPIVSAGGTFKAPAASAAQTRLFLAGSAVETRLLGGLVLSNGDLLLCGETDDLGWTGTAPRTELPATGLTRTGGDRYGIMLQTSGDLASIKRVYHFPKGAVRNIGRIRSTEVPGQPTGVLYISGKAATFSSYKNDGYFLARLDGNGVDTAPTRPLWVYEVKAGERDAIGFKPNGYRADGRYEEGEYSGDAYNAQRQPWDVRNDGGVVYVVGTANDFSWSAMHYLNADGRPDGMPGWGDRGGDGTNFITLKVPNGGPLRSNTADEFSLRQEDENGNPGRKGARPNDIYFSSHDSPHGPGYTGYQVGASNTHRVGEVVIDRRTNHLYFGYNQASKLPDGNPDYEPALVAMDDRGTLKWWARGYQENEMPAAVQADRNQKNEWGGAKLSPPDQYFDHLAIDYAGNRLIATGRAHGGGNVNFWNGDTITANSGRPGFQRGFSGNNGNIHYCWMGAYDLDRLRITAATYVAEYGDDLGGFKPFSSGPLAGWPDPNQGWINLNSTFLQGLAIDPQGRPMLLGVGKRPITSGDALIRNPTPTGGGKPIAAWAPFARVYDHDLGGIAYSTLVRGPWDSVAGRDDDKHEVKLQSIIALQGGFLALAEHTSGPAGGSSIPTTAVPGWGAAQAPGRIAAIVLVIKTPSP